MRSLRSRWILGTSLIAVIPMAMAMGLMSIRVSQAVREQAEERLEETLAVLDRELGAEGRRIEDKLDLLARDPELRRLHLGWAAAGRNLPEYLVEHRLLMDLDYLVITDSLGRVVAHTGSSPMVRPKAIMLPKFLRIDPEPRSRPSVERVPQRPALVLSTEVALVEEGRRIGILHGGVILDIHLLEALGRTSGLDLELRDPHGVVVATTFPAATSSSNPSHRSAGYLSRSVPLPSAGNSPATLAGFASTEPARRTQFAMQGTAILLAWLAVVVAVALGVTWSAQVSRPVERLAQAATRFARGDGDAPLVVDRVRELETLVQAFDRMRADLRDSRARLIVSERHAAWGMMARVVAHEIANPLTPIAVAVADLKRSYERNRADFAAILDQAASTVGEEIRSLRRLLQEFSDFGRLPAPRLAPCSVPELIADVRTLYGHEIASGRLVVAPSDPDLSVVADRALLREALVNLIHNGFEAVGDSGQVAVTVASDPSGLRLVVADDGPGLDAEARARLFTPDFSTKQRGRGLGLVIVERIVTDHGGTIAVESEPGHGTTFRIVLPREPRSA